MSLPEQIERLIDLKTEVEKEVRKLRLTVQWLIGITLPLLIIIVMFGTRIEIRQIDMREDITRINKDYLPNIVMEGIIGSNQKLIEVINTLPVEVRNDPHYLEAVKSRDDFQRDMIIKAVATKRSLNKESN